MVRSVRVAWDDSQYIGRPKCVEWPREEPVHQSVVKAGEIVAWRCWSAHDVEHEGNYALYSTYVSYMWKPGVNCTYNVEEVNSGFDPKPGPGFYALIERKDALYIAECHFEGQLGIWYPMVLGRVQLWGDVIEHEIGFRASHARIIDIDKVLVRPLSSGVRSVESLELKRQLRRAYGI